MPIAIRRSCCLLMLVLLALASGCGAKQSSFSSLPPAQTPPSDTMLQAMLNVEEATGYSMTGLAAGEAITGDEFGDSQNFVVADPLEPWNRVWFVFNDGVYRILLQPLGKGYNYVVPEFARTGVKNLSHNLLFPVRFVNCLLQGKFKGAGVQMARFVGNTAFGLGGLLNTFDEKKSIVPSHDEDFGQTLAVWGVGDGFYLVLPLLGSTTLRDGVGRLADRFADPVTYLNPWPLWLGYEPAPYWVSATIRGGFTFNQISFRLDEYDRFKGAVVEPYAAMRDAYIQNRQMEIAR